MDIRIPLNDSGKFLVAEGGSNLLFKEIYIGIQDEDGCWIDLAVIGENYTYGEDRVIPRPNEYRIKIYDPMQGCELIKDITLEDKEDI